MARIVFISPYLKGGSNAAALAHRTRYFATRPGVELLADERQELPATKKQQTGTISSRPPCLPYRTRSLRSAFAYTCQREALVKKA